MAKVYTALGLMSGTSLDGVDAAIIETDGEEIVSFGPSLTLPYTPEQKADLEEATRSALKWDFNGPPPNALAQAETALDEAHIAAVQALGSQAVDLIGYHGQTVLHRPDRLKTLQLGQGYALAHALNCPTVFDFRTADVAAGGQGAPLAPVFHQALVRYSGLPGMTAVLNLGGVGNVTIVAGNDLLATDTGPANGPLDSFLATHGLSVDRDGSISREAEPDFARIEKWLNAPFFRKPWPKAADRYDFDVASDVASMSVAEGAATLCGFTALSAAKTIRDMGYPPDRVVVCGGGRRNRTIMTMLSLELGCPVVPAETYGWDSDAIEAQAFAYLAVRVTRGLPTSFPTTTGVPEPVVGGQIAYP